jgi:lauroyl/myristoyl acyltransferase
MVRVKFSNNGFDFMEFRLEKTPEGYSLIDAQGERLTFDSQENIKKFISSLDAVGTMQSTGKALVSNTLCVYNNGDQPSYYMQIWYRQGKKFEEISCKKEDVRPLAKTLDKLIRRWLFYERMLETGEYEHGKVLRYNY